MRGLLGSPRMLRAPSARGPNSIRPLNQPITFSSARSAATRSSGQDGARALADAVPDELRDAERAPGVAGRRLDPESLERPLAQKAAIRDAVECHATREAEVVQARL